MANFPQPMNKFEWDTDLADIIEELIRLANINRMPSTEAEWIAICERFCLELYIVRCHSKRTALMLDDVIVVNRGRTSADTQKRLAHELTEYLLSSDWHAPMIVPLGDLNEQKHHVAQLIEVRIKAFLAAKRHSIRHQLIAIQTRRDDTLRQIAELQALLEVQTADLQKTAQQLEEL